MVKLLPGEDVKFTEPGDVGGMYTEFMRVQLRAIAAGLGVTYEQLTGDLERVNYSSIRAGLLEFRRRCEQFQHQVMVFQFCRPVWQAWVEAAVVAGEIDALDFAKNRNQYLDVEWRPPSWDWVDPLKDMNAEVVAVRAGFKPRSAVINEMGYDEEVVDRQVAADNARADSLGLTFDSDPRKTTGNGQRTVEQEQVLPPQTRTRKRRRNPMTNLSHIASRVFNTPLMIDSKKLAAILAVLAPRLGVEPPAVEAALLAEQRNRKPYAVTDAGVAVIEVAGSLVNRASGMEAQSGLTSYEQLGNEILDAATDPQVRGLLLRCDSYGGEANGAWDVAGLIEEAARIKPVWASVDDWALSAGYLMASATDRIWVTRTGGVGSVGIIAMHLDQSGWDAATTD